MTWTRAVAFMSMWAWLLASLVFLYWPTFEPHFGLYMAWGCVNALALYLEGTP